MSRRSTHPTPNTHLGMVSCWELKYLFFSNFENASLQKCQQNLTCSNLQIRLWCSFKCVFVNIHRTMELNMHISLYKRTRSSEDECSTGDNTILGLQNFLDHRSFSSKDQIFWWFLSPIHHLLSFYLYVFLFFVSVSMLHLSKVPIDGAHVANICCICFMLICCDVFIWCLNVRYI